MRVGATLGAALGAPLHVGEPHREGGPATAQQPQAPAVDAAAEPSDVIA
jgi:hypothetical protein